MKYVFVLNPSAGKKNNAKRQFENVRDYFDTQHIPYSVTFTKYPGHATEITRKAGESGEEVRVIAVGGDGTLCEVANGATGYPNVTVGLLPGGSGNDFVKMFGTVDDFHDPERMVNGTAYPMDMIHSKQRDAMNICCAGIDATVAYNMNHYRRMPLVSGSMAYNLAIAQAFTGRIGNQIQVTVDGEVVADGRYLLSAVANGRCYGGGYFASPDSMIDDGVLDVIMVKVPKTRLQIPGLLSVYKTGAHLYDEKYAPLVEVYHGKKVCIKGTKALNFTADGECDQAVKREFEVVHHAIRFLVPQGCRTDCLMNGAEAEKTEATV